MSVHFKFIHYIDIKYDECYMQCFQQHAFFLFFLSSLPLSPFYVNFIAAPFPAFLPVKMEGCYLASPFLS